MTIPIPPIPAPDGPRNAINRIVRRHRPFTMIDNGAVRDSRLSFKAKGLLLTALSHADSWLTTAAWLEGLGPDGRDSVRTGLEELEAHGYLVRSTEKDAKGRIVGWRMTWYECPEDNPACPDAGKPRVETPHAGNPHVDIPTSGKPAAKNTIREEEHQTEEAPPAAEQGGDEVNMALPPARPKTAKEAKVAYDLDFAAAAAITLDITASPDLARLWAEYQGYRADRHHAPGRRRLAWTERAARMAAEAVNRAALTHGDQIVMDRLRAAILGEWQGLNFDSLPTPKQNDHHRTPGNRFSAFKSAADTGTAETSGRVR